MNLLKYSLLALLLAACDGGDSEPDGSTIADSSVAVIDAANPIVDSGLTDGMNQTPDASLVVPDAAIIPPDGGIMIPPDAAIGPDLDGGIVISPDAAIGPDLDGGIVISPDAAVGVPSQCVPACAELTVCFGGGPVDDCEAGCSADLLDCSPAQLIEFDACNAAGPGMQCNDLIACLTAITCIET